MTYNFQYVSKKLKDIIEPATLKFHRFEETLHFKVYNNAYIAPYIHWDRSIGCVIGEDGETIKDSECIEWKENASFYDLNNCTIEHKKVIFIGFILNGFGHSYTDDLRKLWFLNTSSYSLLAENGYELVYTTSWNLPIPKTLWNVFQLAGIDITQAHHITTLTRYDEIVIPDNCFRATDYGRIYCQEYVNMINRIKKSIPESNGSITFPKLYFTRTAFTKDSYKEQGEIELERVFQKLGYTIIIPEDYSVSEQLQMVTNCSHFASTEGSVSHLSLFCKPGTELTIINKANYLNFHQITINEYADLNVTYLEAHHSSKANKEHPWWGPFYLCINRFVERYVQHPIFHFPYWIRFSYWKYSRTILYRCFNKALKLIKCVR